MTIANAHGITANPVAVPNVPRLALSMDLGVEEIIGHSDHFLAFKNLMVSTQGFGFKRVTNPPPQSPLLSQEDMLKVTCRNATPC
jgi:hypothetical protein